MNQSRRVFLLLLNNAPLLLFIALLALFGSLSSRFLTGSNLLNVVIQASSTAVVAIGIPGCPHRQSAEPPAR